MSILRVRIQIYIAKWLFTGKIYNMCKYRIINFDLIVNKWTFFKLENWKKKCVSGIFKLLFNENIINPRMA